MVLGQSSKAKIEEIISCTGVVAFVLLLPFCVCSKEIAVPRSWNEFRLSENLKQKAVLLAAHNFLKVVVGSAAVVVLREEKSIIFTF